MHNQPILNNLWNDWAKQIIVHANNKPGIAMSCKIPLKKFDLKSIYEKTKNSMRLRDQHRVFDSIHI